MLVHDIRYAFRAMRANPGFTVLGIGIWQLAVTIYQPPSYIIPSPLTVWTALKALVASDPAKSKPYGPSGHFIIHF